MSLFSRLFRKPPPPDLKTTPTIPVPAAPEAPRPPDPDVLAAAEAAALDAAIAAGDASTIARLVVEGLNTGLRQRAAHAVTDPVQLRELIRQVRGGKDKSVYRVLTAKRDAELAAQRQAEQLRAEVEAAAAAIDRHSRRPYDGLFAATLEQLDKRWTAVVAAAEPGTADLVRQARERAGEVIRAHFAQIEREAENARAEEAAAAESRRQRELERAAAAAVAAEKASAAEAERRAMQEQQEAEALALRGLGSLLRKAQLALDDGNTGRAAQLRGQFDERLAGAPPLPAWLTRQLQQLDARLAELKDWKTFSVVPKRDALMREMEALVGSTLDPTQLARQIRELRDQWRTLSRGPGEELSAEWQKFDAAANMAYEPCRVFFAAQAEARRENRERREALLERLAAFVSAQEQQGADWRLVLQVLAEARREWRRYSPIDRAAAAALQERFDALLGTLQSRLEAEYARNIEAKRGLIDRAAGLLTSPDIRAATDEAKELQRRWRTVGIVPRDQAEILWEAFRQHCDAVFQRREQESAAYLAGLEANRATAVGLCEELEGASTLSGEALVAAAKQMGEWRAAFDALELPRQGGRELQRRFEQAFSGCEVAVTAQQARDAERAWTDLLEVHDRLRRYALAVARQAEATVRDALRRDAEAALAAIRQWPKGTRPILEGQLRAADAGTAEPDVGANEVLLRALCVRAELLANVPSPPEDQALRREQQLRRLQQAMGQGIRTDAAELNVLIPEWLAVGPTEDGAYGRLLERLLSCRRAAASS